MFDSTVLGFRLLCVGYVMQHNNGTLQLSLFQHKYVSVSDVQIKKEQELEQCPMSLVRGLLFINITIVNVCEISIMYIRALQTAALCLT